MKAKFWFICISLILTGLFILVFKSKYYDWLISTPAERHFYFELEKRIKNGQKEIRIQDLTDFTWEEMFLVCPYGGIPEKYIGPKNVSTFDDGLWAMAFIAGGNKITRVIEKRFRIFKKHLAHSTKCGRAYNPASKIIISDDEFVIVEETRESIQ